MARTKHVVSWQATEEIPIEDLSSSSGEEMEAPLVSGSSEESMAEDIAVEEEASRRHGKKVPEGRVSFKNPFLLLIR